MVSFHPDEGSAILERTPAILRAWLADLSEPWVRATEGPDTWNAIDIVGHLIDGEETDWIPRARIILGQSGERFTPYDRWRHLRVYQGVGLAAR